MADAIFAIFVEAPRLKHLLFHWSQLLCLSPLTGWLDATPPMNPPRQRKSFTWVEHEVILT